MTQPPLFFGTHKIPPDSSRLCRDKRERGMSMHTPTAKAGAARPYKTSGGPSPHDGESVWQLVYHRCSFDEYGDIEWTKIMRKPLLRIERAEKDDFMIISEYYGILEYRPRYRIDRIYSREPGNLYEVVEVFRRVDE